MARGSSYGEQPPLHEIPATTQVTIRRATRVLPEVHQEEQDQELDTYVEDEDGDWEERLPVPRTTPITLPAHHKPLARHRSWLTLVVLSMVSIVDFLAVGISAGTFQRTGPEQVVPYDQGQTFPIQVGGSYNAFNQWENSSGPIVAKTPIPVNPGPYSALGKPTITADFINRVLASFNSPAAGTGQQMYDLGVKYGIDPVYALAFFMHESTFGTTGVARTTLSLGNLRCIPTRPCVFRDIGGFAQMNSWVDGYDQWYKLIRNLYVAQWGLVTIDRIIPVYAPSSDHNDVQGYINALKHEIDTWHVGGLRP